jgi:hypothetical protein
MELAVRYELLPYCFFETCKVEAFEDEHEVVVVNCCTKAGHDEGTCCCTMKNKTKKTADQLTGNRQLVQGSSLKRDLCGNQAVLVAPPGGSFARGH